MISLTRSPDWSSPVRNISFEKPLLPSVSRPNSYNMYFCSSQMPLHHTHHTHHCPTPQPLLLLPPQLCAARGHTGRGVCCHFSSCTQTLLDSALLVHIPCWCGCWRLLLMQWQVLQLPNTAAAWAACKGWATGGICPWANHTPTLGARQGHSWTQTKVQGAFSSHSASPIG